MPGIQAGDGAFSFSSSPPAGASDYFREKSLRPAFRWSEVWGQEHAYAFTVAKATQLDVLSAIKDSLQTAIDEGVPFKAWAANLKPELERLGWWGQKEMADPATGELRQVQLGSPRRLATIYDANLRTARAAGQWERAQRTKAVLPFFCYELGPSMHHRPEHEAREGFIAPVDDPVWNSWYPPNGWGCKCWLQQITRSRADALGGPSDTGSGELAMRTFHRHRDDGSVEIMRVPKGIDPGWANNPGKNRSATLMTALTEKLNAASPEVARQAIGQLWGSQLAQVLPSLPGRYFAPAAIAPDALKVAAGGAAEVVQVSSDVLATKLAKHGTGSRGMTALDVGLAQSILDQGAMHQNGRVFVYTAELEDGWWELVIKSAQGGRELFISTLHPIEARRAERLRKKAGGGS